MSHDSKVSANGRLSELTSLAWQTFDESSSLACSVSPAIPILFFGDLNSYRTSPLRVVTVGLNPSLHEFPEVEPFLRFPKLADQASRNTDDYIASLSSYFYEAPYRKWFNSLESILNGLSASYYPDSKESTALHTDICSPVATDPTWSHLSKSEKDVLEKGGFSLWHTLLGELQPQIVLVSVAREHIVRNGFGPPTDWGVIHKFKNKGDGTPRKSPYEIRSKWCDFGGHRSLFVFGQAAQLPFGTLANRFKPCVGRVAKQTFDDENRGHE